MEIVTSLISAVVGGIVATYLKTLLEKKKELELNLKKITEEKYRGLLIFMACAMDISKKRYFTLTEQVPNETSEDYMNQIKEYYYHTILYSSDTVVTALKSFITEPSKESYIKVAQEMRKDLWGRDTQLTYDDLLLG